jgi:hypothetical protein
MVPEVGTPSWANATLDLTNAEHGNSTYRNIISAPSLLQARRYIIKHALARCSFQNINHCLNIVKDCSILLRIMELVQARIIEIFST